MNIWLILLIVILLIIILWWFLLRGRKTENTIKSREAVLNAGAKVLIEEEKEGEPRPPRKRTDETQELKRRLVHGEYRPIENPGKPTSVEPNNDKS